MENSSITFPIMKRPTSIRDIIGLWPSRADLASDISVPTSVVTADRVHWWVRSSSIPPKFHSRILDAAARRGFPLTADDVVRAHADGEDAA